MEQLPDIKEHKPVEIKVYHCMPPLGRRPVAVSCGPHLRNAALPRVNPDDPSTVKAGIYLRVARKLPPADAQLLDELGHFVNGYITRHYKPLEPDTDISFKGWLADTKYPGWRKIELQEVYDTICVQPNMTYKDRIVKSFVKDESYVDYKHARMINSRSDRFKVRTGPIFKRVEQRVFNDPHFIKKVPIADRPRVICERLMQAASKYNASDYTAFEANFTPQLMRAIELQLYDYMTQHLDDHDQFMAEISSTFTGINHCKFKNGWFEILGTRMSGEMCTSLGNGFSNLMIMLFVAHKSGVDIDCFVEGDDGITVTSGPLDESLFARLGLLVKMETHYSLTTASFCGLVFHPEDLINVTDPREVLAGFAWCSKRYVRSRVPKLRALMRCKALSLAHQYPGCPIIDALAHYAIRVTRRYHTAAVDLTENSRAFCMWEREQMRDALACGKLTRKKSPIATRGLVAQVYGITIEQQLRIEALLDEKNDFSPIEVELAMPASWEHYSREYVMCPVDLNDPLGPWTQRKNAAFNIELLGVETAHGLGRPVY